MWNIALMLCVKGVMVGGIYALISLGFNVISANSISDYNSPLCLIHLNKIFKLFGIYNFDARSSLYSALSRFSDSFLVDVESFRLDSLIQKL